MTSPLMLAELASISRAVEAMRESERAECDRNATRTERNVAYQSAVDAIGAAELLGVAALLPDELDIMHATRDELAHEPWAAERVAQRDGGEMGQWHARPSATAR